MENRDKIKQKIESMSKDQLVDLYVENQNNEEQLNWYREQLQLLSKSRFSSTSEKVISGQLNLLNEIEDINDTTQETDVVDDVVTKDKSKKKKQ